MSTSIRFLVVDDFSTMRRIIKNFLNDLGYTSIAEADDGKTALPVLKAGDVAVRPTGPAAADPSAPWARSPATACSTST